MNTFGSELENKRNNIRFVLFVFIFEILAFLIIILKWWIYGKINP